MKNRRNYYRILHVQPDAPAEIIKASYRTLMQKLKNHPDLGGDEWNASVLNMAYATLSNSKKRAEYDQQFLHRIKKTQSPDNRKHHAEKTGKTGKERKSPEYWKDPSVCPFCGMPKPARSRLVDVPIECRRCSSPLKTVASLEIAGKTQRKLERSLHDAPVRIYTRPENATALHGVIRDLSPLGMQLEIDAEQDVNQVIRIASGVLSATARVCYCKQGEKAGAYIIGVKFLTLQFHSQTGVFLSEQA